MKKILSLVLSSLILLSLFSGFTVSAANSVALDDGGTLWHQFPYDTSKNDVINNNAGNSGNLHPTIETADGRSYAKFTVGGSAETYAIATGTTLQTSTDRYVVIEYDFKKDDTTYTDAEKTDTSDSPYVKLVYRTSADKNAYLHPKAAITEWTHFVTVIDKEYSDTNFGAYSFVENNGVLTSLDNITATDKGDITQIRFASSKTHNPDKSFYVDDLELMTYGHLYTAINSADTVEKIVTIVNRYAALKLYDVPSSFNTLSPDDKASVAANLLNKNFATDADVVAAMNVAMTDFVIPTKYFDWDFENGTLIDSVNNKAFMSENGADRLEIAVDPKDSTNKVAKMPVGNWGAGPILMRTNVIDNALANDEFDYLTVDFKIYGEATNANFPIYLQLRNSSDTVKPYIHQGAKSKNKWYQFRSVINTAEKTINTYVLENGVWTSSYTTTLPDGYSFYRWDFVQAGANGDIYYDDFKISGYKDVITEVMESSAAGMAGVLEVYDELQIVELPASYAKLDDAGKLALGTYIKANVTATTTVAQLNEYIKIGASSDELVVLSTENDESGKLDTIKMAIKKADINVPSAQLIVATYANDSLEDVKICDITTAITNGASLTATGLGIDLAAAAKAKLILVNSLQNLKPIVKATDLK